jgi:hypothetical protein
MFKRNFNSSRKATSPPIRRAAKRKATRPTADFLQPAVLPDSALAQHKKEAHSVSP